MLSPTQQIMIDAMSNASPSFKSRIDAEFSSIENSNWFINGSLLVYLLLGDFARHMVTLFENNNMEEFRSTCTMLENLYELKDKNINEYVTIGILEALQNINCDGVEKCLGKTSRNNWKELNVFWKNVEKSKQKRIHSYYASMQGNIFLKILYYIKVFLRGKSV